MVDLVEDVDPARDHVRGPADALVTVVEYGDFECPACGDARSAVEDAVAAFDDHLRVVFRHLPVPRSHPNAVPAALAAEAAADQGAFWPMHERLYEHQDRLSRQDLVGHAAALGLDAEAVGRAIDEERFASRIEEDVDSGLRSGVTGTPAFFVDGRILTTGWADGGLRTAVERAVGRAAESR